MEQCLVTCMKHVLLTEMSVFAFLPKNSKIFIFFLFFFHPFSHHLHILVIFQASTCFSLSTLVDPNFLLTLLSSFSVIPLVY